MEKKSVKEILKEKFELQNDGMKFCDEVTSNSLEIYKKGKNFILEFDDTSHILEENIVEIRELRGSDMWIIIGVDFIPNKPICEYVYIINVE